MDHTYLYVLREGGLKGVQVRQGNQTHNQDELE